MRLSPLDKVLIKIFAKGFFRVNSGMLLFVFVVFVSYCFFIETVGHVSLLPPEQLAFYHFIFVRTFISDPLIMLIMFSFWLLYAFKSWRYMISQFSLPNHQFLFYSTTALPKARQVKSWFYVQAVVFLPLVGYWVFALIFGLVFGQYMLPGIILLFILLLTFISALLYTFAANKLIDGTQPAFIIHLATHWPKPYFSLFIYHIFDRVKLGYLLAQLLSLASIVLVSILDVHRDVRLAGMVMLFIATAHSFIVYQNYLFEETRLSFSRNLPYSRLKRFCYIAFIYLILLLPEYIWFFSAFEASVVAKSLLMGISIPLLYHSLLYKLGPQMNTYLRMVFFLFIAFLLLVLFNGVEIIGLLNVLLAYLLFYRSYYTARLSVE
jgi:hypothetical protein